MATVNRIASQVLRPTDGAVTSGELDVSAQEGITLEATATKLVGDDENCQARLVVTSPDEGDIVLDSVIMNMEGDRDSQEIRKLRVVALPDTIEIRIEVPIGRARVIVNEQTGLEATGATLELDDIPDDIFTADAAGRAPFADGLIPTAMMAAGAVDFTKLDLTGLKVLSAAGVNSGGGDAPVTLTGAAVGDRVLAVFGNPTAGGAMIVESVGTDFEATISVVDEIQQLQAAGDLSSNTYVFLLYPAAA